MPKKSKSQSEIDTLVRRYQRISVVSEIEKNLLTTHRKSFLASDLSLCDVFDEKNYDLNVYTTLESSLKADGFLVPLVVVKKDKGYEIINGVKRYLIARKIGMKEIPCVLADLNSERKESYIIENIIQENDCALVKTTCFRVLNEKHHRSIQEIAETSSLSVNQVRNLIRLDSLPEFLKDAIRSYQLDYGKARTLLGLPEDKQKELFLKIMNGKISVRELEQEKRRYLGTNRKRKVTLKGKNIILTFESEDDAKKAYPSIIKEFSD